jgi:hypothetical protein
MNLFDPVLVIIILILTIYAFRYKKIKLFYSFLREIFIFATATKYIHPVSLKLSSLQILNPETALGVKLLIAFGVAILVMIIIVRLAEFIFFIINQGKIYRLSYLSNLFIVNLSVIVIVTASIFLLMQLTFVKNNYGEYINKSKIYPEIKLFYSSLLSTKFVKTNIIDRSPSLEIEK